MSDLLAGKQIKNNSITKEKLILTTPTLDNDPVTKEFLETSISPILGITDNLSKGSYPLSRLSVISQATFLTLVSSFSTPQTLIIDRPLSLTSSYSLPNNIKLEIVDGAPIDLANGVVLTVNSTINAGDQVLFTGLGKAILKKNTTVNVKWFNLIGDGITDESVKWKYILEEPSYKKVLFPQPVSSYILDKVIVSATKKIIEFEEGTIIQGRIINTGGVQSGTLGTFDHLLHFSNCEDVFIKGNGVIIRNNKSLYTPSQNRGAIKLMSCKKMTIQDVWVEDTPGDGWYIGPVNYGEYCERIKIIRCGSKNSTRNGLTVISADNLLVEDCIFESSSGAAPAAGIDLEPNQVSERLNNIKLKNITTKNNAGTGILVVPYKLNDQKKSIEVWIDNHMSFNDLQGGQVGEHTGVLDGYVVWNNPIWENSAYQAFLALNWAATGPRVDLLNPIAINCGRLLFYGQKSVFNITRQNAGGTDLIGNIHIIRPTVVDNRASDGTPPNYNGNAFRYVDAQEVGPIMNCSLIDPVEIRGITSRDLSLYAANASIVISDKYNQLSINSITSLSIDDWRLKPRYTNIGATTPITFTLKDYPITDFPREPEFYVYGTFPLRVELGVDKTIRPLGMIGSYLESDVPRSKLKIKKISQYSWELVEMTGVWKDSSGAVVGPINTLIGARSVINSSQDLDNITAPGSYAVEYNDVALTLQHSPSTKAGDVDVDNNGKAVYQRYREFKNGPIYERSSQFSSLVGVPWKKVTKGFITEVSYNIPNVPANSYIATNFTVTGALVGQVAHASLNRSILGLKPLTAVINSADTVTVFFENPTGSAIDVDSGILRIRVEEI